MASLATMEKNKHGARPTVACAIHATKEGGYVVNIPSGVPADSVRENVNIEKGKTNFGITCVPTIHSPDGKVSSEIILTLTEGDNKRRARFGVGVVNMQFRGFVDA